MTSGLVAIWAAGMTAALLVLLAGLGRLGRLRAGATPVTTGPWRTVADEIAIDLGMSRPVQLLQSRHPTMLATWGLVWPKVMLPAGAQSWPRHRVRIVVAHELAHVRHGDWVTQLCGEVLRAVFWFNPLTWMALHRLRRDSELACDDEVLGLGVDGPAYATHLLALARILRPRRAVLSPGVAMARPSGFERRITAMMNPSLRRQPLMGSARTAVLLAALCFTIPLAILAQSGSGSLVGTVVDSAGQPWSGARVTLSPVGMEQLQARIQAEQARAEALEQEFQNQEVLERFRREMEALTAQTDDAGRFEIANVPAGDYDVRVRRAGFVEIEETVSLATGQQVRREFALTVGSVEETLTVSPSDAAPAPITADPEALARMQSNVTGRLQPPIKVRSLNPTYPEDLRSSGAEGQVILETVLTAGGSVEIRTVLARVDPVLLQPVQPEFARSAVEAVRQWQYRPTRLNDVPIDTPMKVTINFADGS